MFAAVKSTLKRVIPSSVQQNVKMAYHRLQFHKWTHEDQQRLEFYQQFIKAGDLVFDVGTNLGNRSKIFLKLGAKVVGIEPQPRCVDFLKSMFKNESRFHLEQTALGSAPGEAEMAISDASTISSLSTDWMDAVKESGRFGEASWNKTIKVPITTLDHLIQKYGTPAFIKIDVEGFEDQVISGLHQSTGPISLEFTPEYIQGTLRCINHLAQFGTLEYQVSMDESMEYSLPNWVNQTEIVTYLEQIPKNKFGDLYARFRKA
jgi:FkbM family methyltransferase